MLKPAAIIFGIFFLVAGIGGFVPALAPNGMLFGVFMVGPIHNCIHLASGVAALLCAFLTSGAAGRRGGDQSLNPQPLPPKAGQSAARTYFQIFGVVYLLVAVIGFVYGNTPLLGMVEHNKADIGLHLVIAAASLYLGFMARRGVAEG